MANEDVELVPPLERLYHQFQDETDRAVAIVGAAYLDELLRQVIASFLVDDGKVTELLEHQLGTLHARITVAYSMGLISKDELGDLTLIRRIRNRFAHERDINSFLHKDIAQQCNQLSPSI